MVTFSGRVAGCNCGRLRLPRLTAKRVEPVVSISWASCISSYRQVPRSATCRYCSQKSTFCPRRGETELDRKMVATSHNGHDELYHRVKFGGDRTTSAGCRCENIVFVCMFVLCHAQRPARCSFEGCIVRTSIALLFIGRFRRGFQLFFRRKCSFRRTTATQGSRNCGLKFEKV